MIRIAITGPESSGKTTLAEQLAKHFETVCTPEYAREFLASTNGVYNQDDLPVIAHYHLQAILKAEQAIPDQSLHFIDTDFIVMGVWSAHKYGDIPAEIEALIQSDMFDLHILCSPEIPWEEDPLRENPDDRHELFRLYEDNLKNYGKQFIVIEGNKEERLKKAIEAIDILKK